VLGLYRVHVTQMTHREQQLVALVRRRTLELEQANRGLLELATHDELTGAPNQRLFKTFVDRNGAARCATVRPCR